jgi:hypothetical protein
MERAFAFGWKERSAGGFYFSLSTRFFSSF